ncbi:MAG: hypothetical protein MJE66_05300 [Proteobacteria bacterium]|nr:hypothetical protein [Pseudomonadota bacterium]
MHQLVLAASTATVLAVWAFVGVRILLVARRTRGFAEFSLGLSCFLLGGLAVPTSAMAHLSVPSSIAPAIGITSAIVTMTGFTLLFAFTARAFHFQERWAMALVWAMALYGLFYVIGNGQSWLAVETRVDSSALQRQWAPFTICPALVGFSWTGLEAARQYRMMRRRFALGMADAVVTNRMLLWGLLSAVAIGDALFAGTFLYLGSPLGREIQQVITGMGTIVASVCLVLAFAPPKAYLRWVRRVGAES